MNSKTIRNLVIGVLILILIFFVLKGCFEPNPEQESKTDLPNWYADDMNLIPQKGNYACWAATLNMMGKGDSSLNHLYTNPIHADSLASHLTKYNSSDLNKINDPDWNKIKNELYHERPLAVYKYYNESFAHVFTVRGYHQSDNYKWLMVNDPWPVNRAKIAALDFKNFTRPFDGNASYRTMSFKPSSSKKEAKEPNFTIYSTEPLASQRQETYLPVLSDFHKTSQIEVADYKELLGRLNTNFEEIDSTFYKAMQIDFVPEKEDLGIDFTTSLQINNFNDTASFINYSLKNSQKPDYLFNATLQIYTNFKKNKIPIITSTIDYENKSPEKYLYVSRFEAYGNSVKEECDIIFLDFAKAMKKPAILKFFMDYLYANFDSKKPISPNDKRAYAPDPSEPNIVDKNTPDAELQALAQYIPKLKDFAKLPFYGGFIYSFILPGFPEKIVADPHRQLKLRTGQKALFIGDSGTPYYRLSAIELPEWGEIVNAIPSDKIPVEWKGGGEPTPLPDLPDPREILNKILNTIPPFQIEGIRPAFDGKTLAFKAPLNWITPDNEPKTVNYIRTVLRNTARTAFANYQQDFLEFDKYISRLDIDIVRPTTPDPNKPDPVTIKPEELLGKILNGNPPFQIQGVRPRFDGKTLTFKGPYDWVEPSNESETISYIRSALRRTARLVVPNSKSNLQLFDNYISRLNIEVYWKQNPNSPNLNVPMDPKKVLNKILNSSKPFQVEGVKPTFDGKTLTFRPEYDWLDPTNEKGNINLIRDNLFSSAKPYLGNDNKSWESYDRFIKTVKINIIRSPKPKEEPTKEDHYKVLDRIFAGKPSIPGFGVTPTYDGKTISVQMPKLSAPIPEQRLTTAVQEFLVKEASKTYGDDKKAIESFRQFLKNMRVQVLPSSVPKPKEKISPRIKPDILRKVN